MKRGRRKGRGRKMEKEKAEEKWGKKTQHMAGDALHHAL